MRDDDSGRDHPPDHATAPGPRARARRVAGRAPAPRTAGRGRDDRSRFEALYAAHGRRILAVAARRSPQPSDAADVVARPATPDRTVTPEDVAAVEPPPTLSVHLDGWEVALLDPVTTSYGELSFGPAGTGGGPPLGVLPARQAGDELAAEAAVDAMATSHDWAVLAEMNEEGDWPEVVWELADAMPTDAPVSGGRPLTVAESYDESLGCWRTVRGRRPPGAARPGGGPRRAWPTLAGACPLPPPT